MFQDKYVFAQLTAFLNRTPFSISLTDKTHLRDLFDKTNFNDVKDQFGPLIPGLFD